MFFFNEKQIKKKNREILMKFLDNPADIVSLKALYYFMIAPTLCFQLHYPTRSKIRKIWLLKRVIELIIICSLQM